jgi:8-oxo-dGTP diphosphatase
MLRVLCGSKLRTISPTDASLGEGSGIDFSAIGISRFIRYIFPPMVRAAVAILQQEKRVLICQRKKHSRYELKWEFPGGKVEVGESLLECLKRELREELSIEIDGVDRSESRVNRYGDGGDFEVSYFFVSRFTGTPTNNVFEQIRWVTLAELKTLDILEGNKPLVAHLNEAIFL